MNGTITNKRRLNDSGEWEDCKQFFLDGKEVTEVEFLDAFPDQEIDAAKLMFGHCSSGWPMIGDALAVHPKQVEQARERAKRHGINVGYLPNGRVVIPDKGNYSKLLKLEGKHHNNSFDAH